MTWDLRRQTCWVCVWLHLFVEFLFSASLRWTVGASSRSDWLSLWPFKTFGTSGFSEVVAAGLIRLGQVWFWRVRYLIWTLSVVLLTWCLRFSHARFGMCHLTSNFSIGQYTVYFSILAWAQLLKLDWLKYLSQQTYHQLSVVHLDFTQRVRESVIAFIRVWVLRWSIRDLRAWWTTSSTLTDATHILYLPYPLARKLIF